MCTELSRSTLTECYRRTVRECNIPRGIIVPCLGVSDVSYRSIHSLSLLLLPIQLFIVFLVSGHMKAKYKPGAPCVARFIIVSGS